LHLGEAKWPEAVYDAVREEIQWLSGQIADLLDAASILDQKVEAVLAEAGLDPSDQSNELELPEACDLSYCRNQINDVLLIMIKLREIAKLANADALGSSIH
jgi:hypothetical protein